MADKSVINSSQSIVLVVPLWNEFSRGSFVYLEELVRIPKIDFIFVNDGSTDRTLEELKRFETLSNVEVINLTSNQGKSNAIKIGMTAAFEKSGSFSIGFLDGDGAFPLSEVKRLSNLASDIFGSGNYEILISSRVALAGRNIKRNVARHYLGRAIRTIIDLKHKALPYDTQSGFKIFMKSETLKATLESEFRTRWFIDIELLLKLKETKGKLSIWEEPLFEWHDVEQSSISWRSIPRIIMDLTIILKLRNRN